MAQWAGKFGGVERNRPPRPETQRFEATPQRLIAPTATHGDICLPGEAGLASIRKKLIWRSLSLPATGRGNNSGTLANAARRPGPQQR